MRFSARLLPAALLLTCTIADASVIEVPAQIPTIQGAIDAAVSGDEIVVSPGTYSQKIDLSGKAVTLRSASGNPLNTTIDWFGFGTIVVCINNEGPDTVIEGFTIRGGNSIGGATQNGGGLLVLHASPTIRNCRFVQNAAILGGGAHFDDSSSQVTDCQFNNNAAQNGGGVYLAGIAPTFRNCQFNGNTLRSGCFCRGGGACVFGEPASFIDCTFNDNVVAPSSPSGSCGSTQAEGGGVFARGSTFVRCEIANNSTVGISNQWPASAGGVHGGVLFSNCVIRDNSASGGGVDGWVATNPSALLNCTVLNDGVLAIGTISNSIVWSSQGDTAILGDAEVTYCIVRGGHPGEGNSDVDPLLAANGEPNGTTPIDSGNDLLSDCRPDIDGRERFFDDPVHPGAGLGAVDIGAFEVGSAPTNGSCGAVSVTSLCNDCNGNGIGDLCEVEFDIAADCNGNGAPDVCDVELSDCNRNGVPDDCESTGDSDCNENGIADVCDILAGSSNDCDGNGVLDECDVEACGGVGAGFIQLRNGAYGLSTGSAQAFGRSIVGGADVDGDGIADLAVATSYSSSAGTDGAVWILFMRQDGSVRSHQEIRPGLAGFTGEASVHLGVSIAWLDDLDGDGIRELAAGDPSPFGSSGLGTVWVLFLNPDGTVREHKELTFGAEGDQFGSALAVMEPLGGLAQVAVGAQEDDAVWLAKLVPDGTMGVFARIGTGSNGMTGPVEGRFGASVTSIGDVDGNGVDDLAVGSPYDDKGVVWILFLDAASAVIAEQRIGESDGGFTGQLMDHQPAFGASITRLPDLDHDGIAELAVGAPRETTNAQNLDIGTVFVLFLNTDGTVREHVRVGENAGGFSGALLGGDRFGSAVASFGDQLLVGSPLSVLDQGGSVYVLTLPPCPDCNLNQIPDACETDCNENGLHDDCDIASATSADINGNSIPDECETCAGDTDVNGTVNVDDLVNVILDWGTDGIGHGGDVTGDGIVDVDDLVQVILAWGNCVQA